MSYPYSSQSHTTVNPTTADFSYSDVPLLADVPHKDQLKVYENGQLRTFSNTGDDNYTLVVASELVRFNTNRSQGVTIKIARETDIENKEVTFTNSSVLTAQDLNKNSDQLLFLAQELYDKAQDISLTAAGGIPPNSIGSSQLVSDAGLEAVTTSVIRDDAVTTAKIENDAVTTAKIDDDAVTTAKILDLNVTTSKINDLAVTTGKINDGAITAAKMNIGFFEYKEWTPVLKVMDAAGTVKTTTFTGSPTYGYVTKLGKMVFGTVRVGWDSYTLGNGVVGNFLFIDNLPYPVTTAVSQSGGHVLHGGGTVIYNAGFGNVTTMATRLLTYPTGAYSQRLVFFNNVAGLVPLSAGTAGGTSVIFQFEYLTD